MHDLVEHSERAGDIVQGDEVGSAMMRLRTFMFEHVYLGPAARTEHARIERVLRELFEWYCSHPDELPAGVPDASPDEQVIDWVAGMTDRFAIRAWTERFVPQGLVDLMARYTEDSRERVRDAVDFADLVGARTELRRRACGGCRACARSTRSARRRSGSTRSRSSTTASAAGWAATSSRS